MKKITILLLILSVIPLAFAQTVVPPEDYDSRCDYYCPDPEASLSDYWNITTTNKWCFQNGHVCEAASNYAGCEDIRHGSSGNRYWCSECRCEDVNDCDAPGRCANNEPLPTCSSVGKLDCNGVPTYKDPDFGGNGCPTGCSPGPSCDGVCACSNAIEFAYCCQEIPIMCGDGKCNLQEETCEFVDGEGKLCTTGDEGKAPTGGEAECRQPGHSKECTTCGDGVWQSGLEECDYACTPETCPNGGYNPECTLECRTQLPFTEVFCVKLTMGGSACLERWASNMVCNFNNVGQSQGKVDELDLLSLRNKMGSTNNVDLAIFDMDSDRDIDDDDLEICTAFFVGNS